MAQASRDQNFVPTLTAASNSGGTTPVAVWADPTTHRLLVDLPSGSGTVTDVSVVSANGFAGSVATSTTTPAITLSTTINSPVLAGNGTAIAAATTSGTGSTVLLQNSPTLVSPALGTPTSGVATNLTGTATALNIGGTAAGLSATLVPSKGGTGVANNDSATVTSSGNFAYTRTLTGTTNVTFATSGTLTTLAGVETLSNKTLTAPKIVDGGYIADANGNQQVLFHTTASAVNWVGVTNAATGTLGALIAAEGETNVDIRMSGKGTGKVHHTSSSFGDITSYTPNVGSTATLTLQTSNIHNVTFPAGNIVLAVSNAVPGQIFTVRLVQDGGGSRTVTWFSTIKWAGGTQPTLTTTGGKADTFVFLTTSAGNYDGYIAGQNI